MKQTIDYVLNGRLAGYDVALVEAFTELYQDTRCGHIPIYELRGLRVNVIPDSRVKRSRFLGVAADKDKNVFAVMTIDSKPTAKTPFMRVEGELDLTAQSFECLSSADRRYFKPLIEEMINEHWDSWGDLLPEPAEDCNPLYVQTLVLEREGLAA